MGMLRSGLAAIACFWPALSLDATTPCDPRLSVTATILCDLSLSMTNTQRLGCVTAFRRVARELPPGSSLVARAVGRDSSGVAPMASLEFTLPQYCDTSGLEQWRITMKQAIEDASGKVEAAVRNCDSSRVDPCDRKNERGRRGSRPARNQVGCGSLAPYSCLLASVVDAASAERSRKSVGVRAIYLISDLDEDCGASGFLQFVQFNANQHMALRVPPSVANTKPLENMSLYCIRPEVPCSDAGRPYDVPTLRRFWTGYVENLGGELKNFHLLSLSEFAR